MNNRDEVSVSGMIFQSFSMRRIQASQQASTIAS